MDTNFIALARLTRNLARRSGPYLERQGLLERDSENSYLVGDELEICPTWGRTAKNAEARTENDL